MAEAETQGRPPDGGSVELAITFLYYRDLAAGPTAES